MIGAAIVAWQSGGGGAAREKRVARSGRDVRVPAPGLVFRDGTWQRPPPGRQLPRRVRPPADGLVRVSGAVVDAASGKPVPDVEVVFADGQSESTTQSDMAGRYSIDVEPGHYRPFVRAAGIISVGEPPRERLPRRPSSGEVAMSRLEVAPDLAVFTNLSGADLEVVRAGVIAGRVFDRDGRPIAGALVRAMPSDGQQLRPVLGTDVAETDLDGTFRLELGEAHYLVEAFHDRYGATESAPTVNLIAGDTATADLTMVAGCVVTGRIVRADGNEPGDGAIERAWSADATSGYYPSGTFEEDGAFRWSTNEEGDVTLRVWPWKAPPSTSRTFACRDGARFDDVMFTIPSTRADLGGTILTAGGAPAARAFIDIAGMSDGTMNQQERADDEGRWEVFALPPGTYQVTAYVEGEGAASAVVTSPGTGNTLRLSGSGTLVGRATGLDDGSFSLTVNTCETEHTVLTPRSKHLVTVQNGSYRIDGLPACAMRGEITNHVRARPFDVTITAGGVTTLDLDMSAPKPKTITGTIRDQDGNPVENASLTVITSGLDDATSATTDASGRFSITAHGGDILIVGSQVGTAELVIADDDPDTKQVDITLTPGDW
ncbi:MAG TPA: carboxypeptidase-like regulatory domain-containing protein [Kofleriaceae bacterium]|nr:carboxypeptidase-like regulatory domain-containing protein [Kofleriaceae bacterium]